MLSPTQATTSKIEWQDQGRKFFSLQMGAWVWNVTRQCYSDNVATVDQLTQVVTAASTHGIDSFESRNHSKGSMSWLRRTCSRATMTSRWDSTTRPPTPIGRSAPERHEQRGDPVSHTRHVGNYESSARTTPFQMAAWNNCYKEFAGLRAKDLTHTTWVYAQDSWTIARRLTLNLGARYAHAVGFIPEQCRSASMLRSKPCTPRSVSHRVSQLEFTGAPPRRGL